MRRYPPNLLPLDKAATVLVVWVQPVLGRGEVVLQILLRCLGLRGPLHWACLLQDLEKGKGTLRGLGDESAHGGNAASEPMHILDPLGRLDLLDSLDLVWACLDPTL